MSGRWAVTECGRAACWAIPPRCLVVAWWCTSMFGYAGGAVLAVLLATAAVQLLLFHGRGGSSVGYVRQHGHRGAASAGAISGFGGPAGHRDGQSGPGSGDHRPGAQYQREPAPGRFGGAATNFPHAGRGVTPASQPWTSHHVVGGLDHRRGSPTVATRVPRTAASAPATDGGAAPRRRVLAEAEGFTPPVPRGTLFHVLRAPVHTGPRMR